MTHAHTTMSLSTVEEKKLSKEELSFFIYLDFIDRKMIAAANYMVSHYPTFAKQLKDYLQETFSFKAEEMNVSSAGITIEQNALNSTFGSLIRDNDIDKIKTLLLFKPDINGFSLPSGGYCVPLCSAAKRGLNNIVELLLEAGANPDAVDQNGRTLHSYLIEKNIECKQLINNSLFPSGKNVVQKTQTEEAKYQAIFK